MRSKPATGQAPRTPDSSTIPPLQARSRRTAERIVAAALELLGDSGIESVRVTEIARRAGVSIGSFYARFPGKDALLQYLQEAVLDGALENMHAVLSKDAAAGLGARDIVHRYTSLAIETFRRHRSVLRQVSLKSRTSSDASFRHRVLELNIALHDVFRSRLYEREAEIDHPDPHPAIDIGLTAISAVMREYVLFGDLRPQFSAIDDDRLVVELTELFARYLRI